MGASDWISVAAIVVSVVSAVISGLVGDRRARRSAEEAGATAQRAQETAEDISRSMDSIAQSLGDLANTGRHGVQAEDDRRLEPRWNIERGTGHSYVLRNVGSATATQVSFADMNSDIVTREVPNGDVTLEPAQGHRFLLAATMESGPLPPDVLVSCAEIEPRRVALPPT